MLPHGHVATNGDTEAEGFNGQPAYDEGGLCWTDGEEHKSCEYEKTTGGQHEQSGVFHVVPFGHD
jgi:hypothetical protein